VRYLVDAVVLSEPTRPRPRCGRRHLAPGSRRDRLEQWFAEGVARIACVPWDAATGLRWATLLAELRSTGRQMPIKDSLIAATALVHDLTVVTRNVRDFRAAGVRVIDPFGPPFPDG
jgi:predicted nucleic acid-binding protein